MFWNKIHAKLEVRPLWLEPRKDEGNLNFAKNYCTFNQRLFRVYLLFVICCLIRIIPTLLQYMKWNISFSLCNISTRLYTTYQVPFMKLIAVLRKIKSRQPGAGNTSLVGPFSFLSWHSTIREWLSGSSKSWKHFSILF